MVDWEIVRYKCQLRFKPPVTNRRWETVKITYDQDEAERWLRAAVGTPLEARVIKEEVMRLC